MTARSSNSRGVDWEYLYLAIDDHSLAAREQAFVGPGAYALFAAVALAGFDPLLAIPMAGCLAAAVAAILGPLLFRLEGPYFAIGS